MPLRGLARGFVIGTVLFIAGTIAFLVCLVGMALTANACGLFADGCDEYGETALEFEVVTIGAAVSATAALGGLLVVASSAIVGVRQRGRT